MLSRRMRPPRHRSAPAVPSTTRGFRLSSVRCQRAHPARQHLRTIDEDVWRRDFTANALYYNIADFSVWDYVGGAQDIAARTLKLIGDPETRFREDPVRMLRGARFEAKLGLSARPRDGETVGPLRDLLAGVPPARLFDETLKLFRPGTVRAASSAAAPRPAGGTAADGGCLLQQPPGSLVEKLLLQGLKSTDARVLADKPVTPTFLFALLLYGPIAAYRVNSTRALHDLATILDACDRATREAQSRPGHPEALLAGRARDVRAATAAGARARPARVGACWSTRASRGLRPVAVARRVWARAA